MTQIIPDGISWHEGMLLSPQHFQEMDRRIEGLLRFHSNQISPYHWGMISRQIDDAKLAGGVLRFLSLQAVLPDSMVVDFRDEESRHLEIDLHDHFEALKATPQLIYLSVVSDQGGANPDQGELRRYQGKEGDPISDWNGGGTPVRIARRLPFVRLVFGKPSKLFTAFPICEVTYKDNALSLTRFSPPVLAVTRDLEIGRICYNMVATLRRKANHLAGVLASGDRADENIIRTTETTLEHLVAGLPKLEALLGANGIHPFQIYLAMVELMSSVVNLSSGRLPPQLEPYNHDNLVATYNQVDGYIKGVLDERIHESFAMEQFKRDGHLYHIHFKPEWVGQDLVLGFSTEAGTSDNDAEYWVFGSIVGARSLIYDLRQRRVLGVEREKVKKISGLVPPEDTLLFRLNGMDWIIPDEDLVVSPSTNYAGKLKPLSLTLYIRNPNQDGDDV